MLNFIIQHFHHKTCNKQTQQPCTPTPTIERVVVEIDYDKLAEATIAAQEKADEQKRQQEAEKQQEQQAAWEKALWCHRYAGKNWLIKVLLAFIFPIRLTLGVIFFRKKNATSDRGTYALLRICNEFMLGLYAAIFYGIAIISGISCIDYLCPWFEIAPPPEPLITGGISVLCLVIASIIRIAKLEARYSQDKNTITVLFNALVAFTAMLIGIIAIIVALNTGGTCTCVQ